MRQMFFDLTSRARFVLGVLPGVFAILMLTAGCEPASETEVASSGQSAVSDETTLNNGATEGSQNEAADNRAGQSGQSRRENRNHTSQPGDDSAVATRKDETEATAVSEATDEGAHSEETLPDETDDIADELPQPAKLPGELWDVSYIKGQKVGKLHTTFTPVKADGKEYVDIDQQGSLSVSRFGTPVTIGMTFKSRESATGELVGFRSTLNLGPLPNMSQGMVRDRSLETTITTAGKKTTKTLAWNPEWGGFFAVDQSLRAKPMQPGETREFKSLMPLATDVAVADVKLVADDYETTKLLEGDRELLRITVTMKTGGPHDTEQTIWTDRRGEVIKQHTDDLGGMTTYRTSREIAMRRDDAGSFDLGRFSTVSVGNIDNAHGTKKVIYRVKTDNADPLKVFSHCGSQQVKSVDDHSADVTVLAIGPETPAELAVKPSPPEDADLAANNLIQSDDRRIRELAASVLPNEKDNWTLAAAMEKAVYRKMTSKNFSTAFATAAEVAQSFEGDCTEHAVLLAALCRARKIPARVAIGLVYYAPQRGFAFHMWNEVWTGDRWVPLDATLGRGGIGAAHLKLADSSLAGSDGFSAFMPVAKVMGQLDIKVMQAD